jgi:sulfate/thiosulfate transport system permease protein
VTVQRSLSLSGPHAFAPTAHTRRSRVLPGLPLSLSITGGGLAVFVLIPLSTVLLSAATLSPARFWAAVGSARALASYRLSFGASLAAALVNAALGLLFAWVLVRYRFPGRRILDALVDLPFALPTAVSGIALTAIYASTGPVGRLVGIPIAFTPLGVTIALVFIGLPFVVRAVAPVLAEMGTSAEEASAVLGATRWQTVTRVTLPMLFPAILTGTALAFARALGEYGSVVFIAGNMPMRTEIAPLLIMTKLDEYDYAGATAVAAVLLAGSLAILLALNRLQARAGTRAGMRAVA